MKLSIECKKCQKAFFLNKNIKELDAKSSDSLLKKRSWGLGGLLRGLRGYYRTPYPLKETSFAIE